RTLEDRDVLDVAEEVEAPRAPFPPDPRIAAAAERRGELAYEEAVHPHGAGNDTPGEPLGASLVAGEDHRRESVARAVGEPDELVLVAERLPGQHRTEDLVLDDLRFLGGLEERRLEVERAGGVRMASPDDPRSVSGRTLDEAGHPIEVLARDQGPDAGR